MKYSFRRKGQLASTIFVVLTIFIIGILFLFLNHFDNEIYSAFDDYFEGSQSYNNSEAHLAVQELQAVEQTQIWDWAFLAIVFGLLIQMVILSFATRIHVIFYWVYGLVSLIILVLGVITSNIWRVIVTNPEFTTTITRFPITDALLGTYYPTFVTAFILIIIIFLFGKPSGRLSE